MRRGFLTYAGDPLPLCRGGHLEGRLEGSRDLLLRAATAPLSHTAYGMDLMVTNNQEGAWIPLPWEGFVGGPGVGLGSQSSRGSKLPLE